MSLLLLPISRLPRPLSGFHRFAIFSCVLLVGGGMLMVAAGVVASGAQVKGWEIVLIFVGGLGLISWAFGRALFWLLTGQ